MPVFKADALILRTYKLGESDRIVVFLTRDRGKKRGVAKGARRPRSRYVGALEPMTRAGVAYYEREQRDLVRLNYVEPVQSPLAASTAEAFGHVGYFAELIDEWAPGVTYRSVRHRDEVEQSKYAFGQVDMPKAELHAMHRNLFEQYYTMADMLLRSGLILPALDYCLKCSHMFNLLDASGGIGVTERMAYILRVRQVALRIAKAWVEPSATKEEGKPEESAGERATK